jgi:adenosylmethionine-8-amino-7-oxononanoate aminotransferase
MTSSGDTVFHRQVTRLYPRVARGNGIYLWDEEGRRYIDGSGGTFVAILGQGVDDIADAIAAQMRRVAFAYTGNFTSEVEQSFTRRLVELAGQGFCRAWLCTSGSTANEIAAKLARHYHLLRGNAEKSRVVARWHSYHGSTTGALSMTGAVPRRRLYEPLLLDWPHVEPPYCYRCPLGLAYPACAAACAGDLEATVLRVGPQYLSAFIVEPVAGGPLGALVTPPEYLRTARDICNRHDMLLIDDEVVSGLGRTGHAFAITASGVVPDIITVAKGLAGGYVPIGAVIVHERIYQAFDKAGISFVHGESFTGHTTLSAAGLATLDYIERHDLVRRAGALGARLGARMAPLADLPIVGEVRGAGLLRGIELVADKATRRPFPRAHGIAERVAAEAAARGLLVLPGSGGADGIDGDTIVLAPPYVITEDEIDEMVTILAAAVAAVASQLGLGPRG